MIHVHDGAMSLIFYNLSYHIRHVYMLYIYFATCSLAVITFPVSLE